MLFVWPRAKYAQKIPSQMEVAPRYRLLTLFRIMALFTLLSLTLCMNTLFYIDCLGHQELKNIAHKGLWLLYSVTGGQTDGWDGMGSCP